MLLPLTPACPAGRPRWPGRASSPATCCAGAPAPRRETLPAPAADLGHRGARAGARAAAGRAARRPALVGRPARGRRPAGHHDRPDRGRPRGRGPHPGPRRRRRPAPASRSATSSPARRRPWPPARSSTRPACGPATWSRRSRCDPAAAPTWCCAPTPLPGLRTAVTAPVPGSTSRFVMVLPQPDGTVYVGLTDEPVDGPVPDVPEPTEPEIGFLLDVVSAAFAHDLRRSDVVGAFAGLRPLLDDAGGGGDRRPLAAARRAHVAQRRGHRGRRQAHDLPADGRGRRRPGRSPSGGSTPTRCRTRTLPLTGAAPRPELARLEEHPRAGPPLRHRRRAGARRRPDASPGWADEELLAPIAARLPASPWPSWSSASPTRGPPTSTTCSTGVPGSVWCPPTAPLAVPAAERALALVAAAAGR